MVTLANKRAVLDAENRRYGRRFVRLEPPPGAPVDFVAAYRNRDWLVQHFDGTDGERLSICRAALSANGQRWKDGVTWDELMEVKAAAGFGDCWAVELFPPADHVIDVANMRHLWLLPEAPAYGWRTGR